MLSEFISTWSAEHQLSTPNKVETGVITPILDLKSKRE